MYLVRCRELQCAAQDLPQLDPLGDFTFMKTQHILGILWLALCSFTGLTLLWQLSHIFVSDLSKFRPTPDLYLAVLLCLAYLAGAVASVFLFRGARWARRFVGLIAALSVIACIGQIIAFRSLPHWAGIFGVIALGSAVVLFWPRHETVT